MEQPKVVLLLVGLVGSGKSTFAQALEKHNPHFRRLSAGLSVCIDRINFDARQRATWIGLAREFSETEVWVLVFDTPYEVCAERLRQRTSHPTIKSPEQGLSVLARFRSQYHAPSPDEGYTRFLRLPPSQQSSNYTGDEVLAILEGLRNSPPPRESQTKLDSFFIPLPQPGSRGYNASGNHSHRGYSATRRGSGPSYGRPYSRPRRARDCGDFE